MQDVLEIWKTIRDVYGVVVAVVVVEMVEERKMKSAQRKSWQKKGGI